MNSNFGLMAKYYKSHYLQIIKNSYNQVSIVTKLLVLFLKTISQQLLTNWSNRLFSGRETGFGR